MLGQNVLKIMFMERSFNCINNIRSSNVEKCSYNIHGMTLRCNFYLMNVLIM